MTYVQKESQANQPSLQKTKLKSAIFCDKQDIGSAPKLFGEWVKTKTNFEKNSVSVTMRVLTVGGFNFNVVSVLP